MPTELPAEITSLTGEEAPNTILVKFYFTNEKLLPPGIPLKERRLSDATRANIRKTAGVEEGEGVFQNLPDTTIADLRQGLERSKFVLADLHYFVERNRRDKRGARIKDRYVVNASFASLAEGHAPASFSLETEAAFHELTQLTWGAAHAIWNPSSVDSILLMQVKHGEKPKHAIVERDGVLAAVALS